jgi:hypothetical protein
MKGIEQKVYTLASARTEDFASSILAQIRDLNPSVADYLEAEERVDKLTAVAALKAGLCRGGRITDQLVERYTVCECLAVFGSDCACLFMVFCVVLDICGCYYDHINSFFHYVQRKRAKGPIGFILGLNRKYINRWDDELAAIPRWESKFSAGVKILAPKASKDFETSVLVKIDQFVVDKWITYNTQQLIALVCHTENQSTRLVTITRGDNGTSIICCDPDDHSHSCKTREEVRTCFLLL